jgi:hypothetical protein
MINKKCELCASSEKITTAYKALYSVSTTGNRGARDEFKSF